ncbi:hypothetical protein ACFLSQ_04070 [Bacteroidota bacterium]
MSSFSKILSKVTLSTILFFFSYSVDYAFDEVDNIINNFEDGKTLNEKIAEIHFALSANPSLSTKSILPKDNETNFFDNHSFSPNVDYYESYYGMLGFKFRLTKMMDLGIDGILGSGVGARLYSKYQLSTHTGKFFYSVFAGISYSHAWEPFYVCDVMPYGNHINYNSNMITGELNFPMSYHISEKFRLLFGAKLYLYYYMLNAEAGTEIKNNESQDFILEKMNLDKAYTILAPAVNFGFKASFLAVEGTFIYIDKVFRIYLGLGLNFSFNKQVR